VFFRLARDLVVTDDLRPEQRRLWGGAVALLYVLAAAGSGAVLGAGLAGRFPDLVTTGDAAMALLAAASCAAVAACLWSVADLIRRSRLASGALLLFLVWEGLRALRFVVELLGAARANEPDRLVLVLHTGALPVVLVLLALWRWEPRSWPIPLGRGLKARGPLDLVAVPLVLGAIAGTLTADLVDYPTWTPQPALYDPGLLARTLGGLLAVPALAWWLRRQDGAPGHPAWLALAGSVLALSLALAGLVWLGDGSVLEGLAGPFRPR